MEISISPAGYETAVIIFGVTIFYFIYFYSSQARSVEHFINKKFAAGTSDIILFFYRKLNGLLMLGIIPAILYFGLLGASGDKFGITFNHLLSSLLLIGGLILLTAVVLFFHHRGNPNRSTLQFNPTEWNVTLFMLNVFGWSLYLVAYEFLFRGILLFECYEALGFWPAVAINVSIYSAIHMVNGKDQTIGALVFGVIACYFALTRGTLLIPIFMHLSLSILSSYYSIRSWQNVQAAGENKVNREER